MNLAPMSRMVVLSVLWVLCTLIATTVAPAQAAAADEGQITLDFKDVELADLIQTISELTGENFIYDETVRGKVTVISPESMTLDEAYQLFLTVLNVKGFTVVPSGKVNKIVPLRNAKEAGLPTVTSGRGQTGDQAITRIFRLDHLDAAQIVPTVLTPLVPSTSHVAAYPPTNSLIITDTAANIARLATIIRELDQPSADSLIEIIRLENSGAEEVAKILNELTVTGPASAAQRRRAAAAGTEVVTKVIPYPAGQALVVMADPADMKMFKALVAQLDREFVGARSNINLYYLENADAVTLATTLNEILTGIKAEARAALAGGQAGKPAGPLTAGPVTITADKPTNSLIINASPDDYRTIQDIIKKLDIKRKQVYVEALILELSMDATQRLGVSLQGAGEINGDSLIFGSSNLNTGPVGVGTSLADSTVEGVPDLLTRAIDGLLVGGFFNPITVTGPDGSDITVPALSVLIDVSKTDSDVNLLSAPRLLTSDNEEAEIIVGANVPIITSRLTDTGGTEGLAQSVAVERQDVALILRFTPQITEGDLVRLNVYQEITDIAASSVGNVNDVGPTFTKRVLRNTVLAENRKTVVLGGLIDSNVIETTTKVPLLGDIPVLGWLFKRKSTTEEKTNLLVFINPTIIKNPGDLDRVTGRNRQAAGGMMGDRVRSALPEDYFDGEEIGEDALAPAPAAADGN